jgi:hypothetical protein
MDYFTIVEDTKAIIVSKGRYQQVDVYRRGTNVYVRTGGSFVRCLASGGTSVPSIRVEAMDQHTSIVRDGLRLQWKA